MKMKTTPKKKQSNTTRTSALDIRPIGEVQLHRSFAFYGRSGSGKTTLSATFPKPLLLLDINDKGTDSISDQKGIDVMNVTSWENIEDVYYFLKENPKKYKTVVFDTITQLQQLCMEAVSGNKKGKRIGEWGSMTRQEFGEVSGLMKDWIINFRDLPMSVVFLAQERVTSQEDTGDTDQMITPEVGPHVMPSVAIALNAAVAIIGNTFIKMRRYTKEVKGKKIEKEEVRYALRVGPNAVYITKLRKPKAIEAPAYIEDPTYEDLMNSLKGV